MDILRFITAGSVDDGKSTLIGRLLYDTKNIKIDLLYSVSNSNNDNFNLAHITDGLRSEREQGITIDVAYKYFTSNSRKYIITDAPGHFQYTKNLVTGASNADLIVILIDAQNGITEQTRRHALVASFLRIKNIIVALNKMDAVNYNEHVFASIMNTYMDISRQLKMPLPAFIPISALLGDNVISNSENMPWYNGPTFYQKLEHCSTNVKQCDSATRFSIQYVVEGEPTLCYGSIISGTLSVNDEIVVNPRGHTGKILQLINGYGYVTTATAGQNICAIIGMQHQPQRGGLISLFNETPQVSCLLDAMLFWLDEIPLSTEKSYILRMHATETNCRIIGIDHIVNITSFEHIKLLELKVNELAKVTVQTENAIAYDIYTDIPECGRGIIIDPETNSTVGAFTINQ